MRPQDIDELFPIAGQDNESAGFRDNFTAIKDSLEYTKDNLDTLSTTTVKKSEANVFDTSASLERVKLVRHSEQVSASGSAIIQATGQEVSYNLGAYHSIVLGNVTGGGSIINIDLKDFPVAASGEQGRYAKLRLNVVLGSGVTVAKTLTFSNQSGSIRYDGSWPVTLSITSQTQPIAVEFWSYDGGQSIFAKYLGTFGQTTRVSTFEGITANGNVVLGNDKTVDTVKFLSIPQLPIFTSGIQRDAVIKDIGQIIYNLETNTIDVVCKGLVDITDGNFVIDRRYVITSTGGSNFVSIGAVSSTVGLAFTATGAGVGLGAGIARELVWKSITPV
jgi:hypothetical protein